MVNVPWLDVTARNSSRVALLMATMSAPGRTAPDVSTTVPTIDADEPPWANPGDAVPESSLPPRQQKNNRNDVTKCNGDRPWGQWPAGSDELQRGVDMP